MDPEQYFPDIQYSLGVQENSNEEVIDRRAITPKKGGHLLSTITMDNFMKEVGDLVAPDEKEERDAVHPYERLEKAKVLQDARIFHDSVLVREDPRKCCMILCQILYMQNDPKSASSKLTRAEATELFFASTKLFVDAEDASLRRLVYLFIKEIRPLCDPSDVIIVTSCLTKDMTSNVDMYRANAIRVLVNIIDSAMLGSIERYMKQAIVDNDLHVSNAALVAASHLFDQSADNAAIVKRWVVEVQETLVQNGGNESGKRRRSGEIDMVQANAMRLLCQMRGRDRLGMAKLLKKYSGYAGSGIRSPLAIVILARLCGRLLREELEDYHGGAGDARSSSPLAKVCFDFLDSSLSHPDDMISYEAARAMTTLPNLGTHDLSGAMECFRTMLFSEKPTTRYAALNTLSKVANQRAVALCNEGLENCIADDNKQIATLAVTTLLKTGSEGTIDRLLGKIPDFFLCIEQDDYKISLLRSLEELCLRYPSKHGAIIGFLANILKEEEGFDFKRAIVESIVSLMREVPEMTENSLLHLCEFIEDCEFTMLSTHTMHIIAELGPTTSAPSRYIRFIYNRCILENATIRAAAVSALSIFAARCPSLRSSILPLLLTCLNDEDDETRDRASVAVSVLEEAMALHPYVAPNAEDYEEYVPDVPSDGDLAALVYLHPLPMSFEKLARSINSFVSTPGAMESTEELMFSRLPIIEEFAEEKIHELNADHNMTNGFDTKPKKVETRDPAAAVYDLPELAEFGRVFRSSGYIPLTEDEAEYVVKCTKHILEQHVILQFHVQNTVEDICIQDITVDLESDSDVYTTIGDVPAENAAYGETVSAFAVLQRCPDRMVEQAMYACQMNFTAIQVDPESGDPLGDGYPEEYPIENIMISPSDYVARVSVTDFRQAWNDTDDSNESVGKFTMAPKTLDNAVSALIELLGMVPCDGTGQTKSSSGGKPHMLHLSGKFLGGHEVLARAQLAVKSGEGTLMKIAIRSDDKAISDAVMSCIN